MKASFSSLFLGIAVMKSGFFAMAEAWITPDLGRNVSDILPHSTPFLNGESEFLDFPSDMYRGALTTQPPSGQECECISKAEIIELLTDDCLDNPCTNGQCIDLAKDYKCDCNPGFHRKNCDFSCPLDKPFYREVDGTCWRCKDGYAGENCELPCPVHYQGEAEFRIVDGVCLRICPEYKGYSAAQGMCETAAMNGFATGRLFEPHTQYFNDKVFDEAIDVFGGTKTAWIGVNAKGGSWVYTNSGGELDIENWAPGQPNSNNNDCAAWGAWNLGPGKWGDEWCHQSSFFICEFV